MAELPIPAETTYTDIERDFIDNEPPGLFPGDQNSYWGQVRKVFADYLQVLADALTTYYSNLDPRTVNADDITEWEQMLGIPVAAAGSSLQQRQSFATIRLERGPFTRARRIRVVEWFIRATMGASLALTPDGLPLDAAGLPLLDEMTSLVGDYAIVEDIPGFHYQVRIKDTILLDLAGLTRELTRITPAAITFDIVQVPVP